MMMLRDYDGFTGGSCERRLDRYEVKDEGREGERRKKKKPIEERQLEGVM